MQAALSEVESLRVRIRELQNAPKLTSRTSAMTNKKDEDDYDVEAAALSGGGSTFKPLVGTFRGAIFPLSSKPAVSLARKIDQLTVALDRKPGVRGGLLAYFVLLHLLVLIL